MKEILGVKTRGPHDVEIASEVPDPVPVRDVIEDIETSELVEENPLLQPGRAWPADMNALRFQQPFLPIEPLPQGSTYLHMASGESGYIDLPGNAQMCTISTTGNVVFCIRGKPAALAAGERLNDCATFLMPGWTDRRFYVKEVASFGYRALQEAYVSVTYFFQA